KKGYLAFRVGCGGNLLTQQTIEDAILSIDRHVEWELENERQRKLAEAERAARIAAADKLAAEKRAAVLACIQPIRDFVEIHGLEMLENCVRQLGLEERERNVPANWVELVELAERIAEERGGGWGSDSPGDIDVDKYGATEYFDYISEGDYYGRKVEYGLQ